MRLTAELVEGFAGTFLSPRYDSPKPTPDFHREAWELYCSDAPQIALAAPRNHAKSTALTHDYGLALVLFREEEYGIILGATEDMAIDHLGDIASELRENEELIAHFGIERFLSDQKTDIVVKCRDGHQFRLTARGAEQKIRGKKWRGKRPGFVIGDDIEDDEQVESADRRKKFFRWLLRACKQALRDGGKMRLHGTILHEDSALAKLMKHPGWKHKLYKAHRAFDDFADILWPEKFPESRLRAIRQELVDANDAAGYSQEYLNDPLDNSDAFLRKDDFLPMSLEDFEAAGQVCVGCDFAVSKADLANRTSFTIGKLDYRNITSHLDFHVGRWSPAEGPEALARGEVGWIDKMFDIDSRWHPEMFFVEGGVIWKAVEKMVFNEMQRRGHYINIEVINPVKDKSTRARSLQKRHRAGATRWNTQAEGFEGAKMEMLRFTGGAQATLDDQFDSAATLHLGFDKMGVQAPEDYLEEPQGDEQGFGKWGRQKEQGLPRPGPGGY